MNLAVFVNDLDAYQVFFLKSGEASPPYFGSNGVHIFFGGDFALNEKVPDGEEFQVAFGEGCCDF